MDLRHLRYFVAVAEELHFARAASRLGIEQSPLSRKIRELEQELGVLLFHRTTRSTRLALAGEALLEDVRRILEAVDGAKRKVQEVAAGKRGRVRCGVVEDSLAHPFSAFLAACRKQAPEIQVEVHDLSYAQQISALRSGMIDIGFVLTKPTANDLRSIELWSDRVSVMLSTVHPLASRRSISLEELAGECFVMGNEEYGPGSTEASMTMLRSAGFQPRVTEYPLRRATMSSLVAAGFGVALVPASASRLRDEIAVIPVSSPRVRFVAYAMSRVNEGTAATLAILAIAQEIYSRNGTSGSTHRRP